MNAVLIVAHGSRREESNNEIRELSERLADRSAQHFDLVDAAFLELASPSIPDGIQGLIDKGASRVLVVPYFLSCGRHVSSDVPQQVELARTGNPDVDIVISDYLGASEEIPELLLQMALSCTSGGSRPPLS